MDLCRVCLATVADGIQTATLFSTTYQRLNLCDMLTACTSLALDPSDGLPNLICANCLANLITSHEFRMQCLNTDQKLREILLMSGVKDGLVESVETEDNKPDLKMEDGQTVELESAEYDVNSAEMQQVETLYDDNEPLIEEVDVNEYLDDDDINATVENESSAQDADESGAAADEVMGEEEMVDDDDGVDYKPTPSDVDSENEEDIPLRKLRTAPKTGAIAPKSTSQSTAELGKRIRKLPAKLAAAASAANAMALAERTAASLRTLKARKPDIQEFPCNVCGEMFYKQYRLNAHMNTHAVSKKYFECDKCKVRFFSATALARHRVKHDENISEPLLREDEVFVAKVECAQCRKKFQGEEALAEHVREHERTAAVRAEEDAIEKEAAESLGGGKFLCEHCPRVFASNNLLNRHIRSHIGAQQFDCELCERTFIREDLLVKHMLRHDSLKKHNCPVCDKVFTHIGTLKSHMRTHSDASPFLCCECGKSFGNSGNLKTHMIRHSGERPYECKQCFSRFPIKGDLHNHMKTHTGVRPATCDICGSSFTRQSTLNKHKLTHIGIRPYPCEMCDMR